MSDPFTKAKLQQKYPTEQVYTVPFLKGKIIPDGYTPVQLSEKETLKTMSSWQQGGRFVMRYDAEGNSSLVQLIPYTIVINADRTKVFVAKRTAGDSRLVSKLSLGFGGHINPCDTKYVVLSAATRELDEELNLKRETMPKFIGYVRDTGSNTSEHLGFVFALLADRVSVREEDNMEGTWMDLDDLVDHYYKFESWSKYLIDYLFVVSTEGRLFGKEL